MKRIFSAESRHKMKIRVYFENTDAWGRILGELSSL